MATNEFLKNVSEPKISELQSYATTKSPEVDINSNQKENANTSGTSSDSSYSNERELAATEAAAAIAATSGELDIPTLIPGLEIVATAKDEGGGSAKDDGETAKK